MNTTRQSVHSWQPALLRLLALAWLCAGLLVAGRAPAAAAQAPAPHGQTLSHGVDATTGLLLHLPLDEAAGNCSFADAAGNHYDGGVYGGTCPAAGQTGFFYRAVGFDGVDNNIQVPHQAAFDFGSAQDFTVMVWMKSAAPGAWAGMVSTKLWWGGTKAGFILSIDSSGTRWTANAADEVHRADAYSSGPALTDDQWHHLAVAFDRSGDMVMYQDGAEVGRVGMAGVGSIDNGNPISIGKVNATEYPYAGVLDDVMVFNRVLSQAEIAGLMQGDCTVSDGGDSGANTLRDRLADSTCRAIHFAGDFTITLTQPLTIAHSVTVDGSGHAIVISGNHNVRVLDINGDLVTLTNLTIRDGGISSCATLASDAGAGIYLHDYNYNYDKTLTLNDSTVSGNTNASCYGGGIFNDGGTVNLVDSTVSGNSSGIWGGGIFDFGGTTNIVNSTIADNYASSYGGGIMTTDSTITVVNSTLVNNQAHGGSGAGGGGIYNRNADDSIVFRNSFITGSSPGGDCAGYPLAAGTANNLADDGTCGSGFTQSSGILPGTLGNYGGSTAVVPLLPGSAALDAGDPAVCAGSSVNSLDQRGQARSDLGCDIGAFEVNPGDRLWDDRPVSGASVTTFGPALVGVQRDAGYTDPGVITVTKSTTWMTPAPESIQAWWNITPTASSGISLTLKLCYLDSESNAHALADLRFWRLSGGVWSQVGGAPVTSRDAFGNNCATISGVTALSAWTLATSSPTAIGVRGPAVRMPDLTLGTLSPFTGLLLLGTAVLLLVRRHRR